MTDTDDRAFEAAWKACSSWDGKITKPVLRKAIEAYVKEANAESRCEELVEALERSMVAINDWLHVYAPDECREADVAESRARLRENGTLWYIANVQEQNRDAIASHRKSNDALKELGKGDGR